MSNGARDTDSGPVVQTTELAAAGAVLGASRGPGDHRRVTRWAVGTTVLLVLAAALAQNVLGSGT